MNEVLFLSDFWISFVKNTTLFIVFGSSILLGVLWIKKDFYLQVVLLMVTVSFDLCS